MHAFITRLLCRGGTQTTEGAAAIGRRCSHPGCTRRDLFLPAQPFAPMQRLICVVSHLFWCSGGLWLALAGSGRHHWFRPGAELLLQRSLSCLVDTSSKAKLLASPASSSSCEELRSKVSKLCLVTPIRHWPWVTSALVRHRPGSERARNRRRACLHSKRRQRAINCGSPSGTLCKSCTCPLWRLASGRGCNPCSQFGAH